MDYYSALKRNELSNHEKIPRKLKAFYKMKEDMKRLYIV